MRDFRKTLAPVSDYMESRKFKGKGRKKYLEDKELRREKEARQVKRKMNDTKYINSAALRRARVEKLNDLLNQGRGDALLHHNLPMIADGAVDEGALQQLLKLESSEEKENVEPLHKQRSCYTCKVRYEKLHHFYDQLCPGTKNENAHEHRQTGVRFVSSDTLHLLGNNTVGRPKSVCLACAELNFSKRMQSGNLHGRVALVTGARVKIGYLCFLYI
jgi:hypothetical protein